MVSRGLDYADGERFTAAHERRGARALGPGRRARLAAHVHAHSLDQALIAGADPSGSASLAARSAHLVSWRTRAQIAEGFERLVQAAQEPPRRWWAVAPDGPALANAAAIRELAALLRGDVPLYARGVAMLNQLLRDGSGPAYRGAVEHLARELREAHAAAIAG
jgi:hypothetical protein